MKETNKPLTLKPAFSKSYSSEIHFLSLSELAAYCNNLCKKQVYIIDKQLFSLYQSFFSSILRDCPTFLFSAEEKDKDMNTLLDIIDFLEKNNVTRDSFIIAAGGGITLDISAFAASIYKRGCSLMLIPTTFVAAIDASVGGKTGINYHHYKNHIGSFYPAHRVLIAKEFLKTLSKLDIMNGWAECIKVALISSNDLYDEIIDTKAGIPDSIIRKAVELKIDTCLNDLCDNNERLKLNLGHTVAHLIESASEYQIPHGIAVSLGVRTIAKLSRELGLIDSVTEEKICFPFEKHGFPQRLEEQYHRIIINRGVEILERDKKANSTLRIIAFRGFQNTYVLPFSKPQELINCLLSL